jgi:hypothetical protein
MGHKPFLPQVHPITMPLYTLNEFSKANKDTRAVNRSALAYPAAPLDLQIPHLRQRQSAGSGFELYVLTLRYQLIPAHSLGNC